MDGPREQRVGEVFVSLADTLVADYDVIDLLYHLTGACTELLAVHSAGLLLANEHGALRTVASSHEDTERLELYQLHADEGPCPDCFRTGFPVASTDLGSSGGRWPRFAPHAHAQGYRSVHARPLRLRGQTIGALNLFGDQPGALPEADLRLAQALADVATISIIKDRSAHAADQLAAQLRTALDSRVLIEQAKGILGERHGTDAQEAFNRLRGHARTHQRPLTDVARDVLAGTLDPV